MFDVLLQYWWQLLLVALGSCLFGSVNYSVIFSRLFKKADVRDYGSGNPGTTNMFRVFGLRMGALTFAFDCLKGVVCCLIARLVFAEAGEQVAVTAGYVAGLFAVVGHVFPVYYGFKGGKGVATGMGVMLVMQPLVMLCALPVAIVIIIVTDRMSVMSMLLCVFYFVWAWVVILPDNGAVCAIIVTLIFTVVFFAHRHNLSRLLRGKELPTGVRKALRGKSDKIVK